MNDLQYDFLMEKRLAKPFVCDSIKLVRCWERFFKRPKKEEEEDKKHRFIVLAKGYLENPIQELNKMKL